MPSNPTPPMRAGYLPADSPGSDLQAEYDRLREALERLLTEPVKDFQKIDNLIDRLELTQLAIKEQHGIKGNNPNE